MGQISLSFRVYFDEGVWVGLFEETNQGFLQVCKVILGTEPQTEELLQMIQKQYIHLKWSPSVVVKAKERKQTPKRLQRMVKHQMQTLGLGTKSQQALQLLHEKMKETKKQKTKDNQLFIKQEKFAIQQRKRKEKHRGH